MARPLSSRVIHLLSIHHTQSIIKSLFQFDLVAQIRSQTSGPGRVPNDLPLSHMTGLEKRLETKRLHLIKGRETIAPLA